MNAVKFKQLQQFNESNLEGLFEMHYEANDVVVLAEVK